MPANPGAPSSQRVQVAPVEGAAALFTPEFQAYLLRLHDDLGARVHALRAKRADRLVQALQHGRLPSAPVSSAAGGDWKVPPVPKDLATPGIEISGPCSITSMFINALNPGPEGERAERDLFDRSRAQLPFLEDATIRAIPLVEALPAVFEMEEMLHALGPYAAGLNAARWDLKASIFEFVMADPKAVWPDRFGVDIKTTPFLSNIFRRLVAVCLKRGAVPIGGIATALPNPNPEVNRGAAESIRADKVREPEQGFIRAWVAHIFHMKTAADPFRKVHGSGTWKPKPGMLEPESYPVRIEVPAGPITLEGTRRNARMVVEYVEGWLHGRGAKGIDSLAGKPGVHPALMEDLATRRMSVAPIAPGIPTAVATNQGPAATHDAALVKRLLQEECADILRQMKSRDAQTEERYRKAVTIAQRWIKNYLELDYP